MIKITLSDLIQLHNTLEGAKNDLEKSLQGIRGRDWREGIDKDKRPSVKILFAELTTTEQKLNSIYNMPFSLTDWKDKSMVDNLMLETGIMAYNNEAEEDNI